jgi:hypothetical protein
VNNFGARTLNDAAHDVNGSVVAVEKRSSGNDSDFIFGLVNSGFHARMYFGSPKGTKGCRVEKLELD